MRCAGGRPKPICRTRLGRGGCPDIRCSSPRQDQCRFALASLPTKGEQPGSLINDKHRLGPQQATSLERKDPKR